MTSTTPAGRAERVRSVNVTVRKVRPRRPWHFLDKGYWSCLSCSRASPSHLSGLGPSSDRKAMRVGPTTRTIAVSSTSHCSCMCARVHLVVQRASALGSTKSVRRSERIESAGACFIRTLLQSNSHEELHCYPRPCLRHYRFGEDVHDLQPMPVHHLVSTPHCSYSLTNRC